MPHEQRDGATHARAAAPPRFPSMYQLGLMILADECPRMANFTCAGWAARAKSTTFARTAGGIICTTSPARDDLTPTGRIDSATTFDSPFSADLLAVWESLFARLWSGRALFDGISGDFCALPLFCGREPFPAVPCQYFSGRGFFVHKILCTDAGETSPPWLFRAVWAESPPTAAI